MFAEKSSELTKRFAKNTASLVFCSEPTTLFTEGVGAVASSKLIGMSMSEVANISRTSGTVHVLKVFS